MARPSGLLFMASTPAFDNLRLLRGLMQTDKPTLDVQAFVCLQAVITAVRGASCRGLPRNWT